MDDIQRLALERIDDLLVLDGTARSVELERLQVESPELAAAMRKLLAHVDEADLVEAPARDAANDFVRGEILGAWRLQQQLGQGGMGEVYVAERADGEYQQRAALKRIRIGLDGALARQSFLRERQVLARLQHPNIARLLDGGVDEHSAPWFAMAYIEGERIDRWCDARKLSLRRRVLLFRQACDAIAYAHRNLVVHRDIKPGNVLVDAEGHVSVLDFGIAKLLDEIDPEQTQTLVMTPAWAAPEQIRGEAVTTASDVYQLGLLLRMLLCGLPGTLATRDRPMSTEIRALMRDTPDAERELARARDAAPESLPGLLHGDLDAIVLRATNAIPTDRYSSVETLSEDLDRWLGHRPLKGARESLWSRSVKFVRRNRAASITGAVAAVLVVAAFGLVLWQAGVARREATRAEQVKDFVLSMFREQDPLSRSGNTSRTPAALVQAGIRSLDGAFAGNDVLRGELLDDLGEIQANLGDIDGGHATLLNALKQRQAQYGERSTEVAITERKLAAVALQKGNTAEVMQRARHAIAILGALGRAHWPEAARAKQVLAIALINQKEREQALPLAREAVADLSAALGPHAAETIQADFRYAQVLAELRHEDEASAGLQRVVSAIETTRGKDAAQLVLPLTTLAGVYRQASRFDEADQVYARALPLARKHFAGRNMRLASVLTRYGDLKTELKEFDAAQALFDQAEAAMPDGQPAELAQLLMYRGTLHLLRDEAEPAEADLRRAFELRRRAYGDDNGLTWYTASEWGRALARQGKLAQAEATQRDALKRLSAIMGAQAYQNALLMDGLADTLMRTHRYGDAAAVLQQAMALTAKEYPPTNAEYKERAERLRQAREAAGIASP